MQVVHIVVLTITCVPCKCVGPDMDSIWQEWKIANGKVYATDLEEKLKEGTFIENYMLIQEHNKQYAMGQESFLMGVNKFADLTQTEFEEKYMTLPPIPTPKPPFHFVPTIGHTAKIKDKSVEGLDKNLGTPPVDQIRNSGTIDGAPIPQSVDWRDKGFVTPVGDQGQCKTAWAFAATGALEGAVKNSTGTLYNLSEQQLLDCRKRTNCEIGGLTWDALRYWKKRAGSRLEEDYPYAGKKEVCRNNKTEVVAVVRRVRSVKMFDEDELMRAVAVIGPIAVKVFARRPGFRFYQSGVYRDEDCPQFGIEQDMLVVGYGQTDANDTAYWILKNSWGISWGMDGYMLMARNENNMCGIATLPTFPVV